MATVELLLAQLGTVVIPAITVQFLVREKLVVGNSSVKIGWFGEGRDFTARTHNATTGER